MVLFKEWVQYLELSLALVKRDLQAQFREALLGFFWLFVPTLAIAASLIIANQAAFIQTDQTNIPYPAYLIFSLILWQLFSESLLAPIQGLEKAKRVVNRVMVPAETFILSKLFEVYTYFLIKLLLVVAALIYFKIELSAYLFLFPFSCILLSLFGTTIGLFLAPFSVLYRDVSQSLPLILNFLMFLTPVVYPISDNSVLKNISLINPITPLLVTTRDFLTSGDLSYLERYLWMIPIVVLLFLFSMRFFRFSWPTIVDRIGN